MRRERAEEAFRAVAYDKDNAVASLQALKTTTVERMKVEQSWYTDHARQRHRYSRIIRWLIVLFAGPSALFISIGALDQEFSKSLLTAIGNGFVAVFCEFPAIIAEAVRPATPFPFTCSDVTGQAWMEKSGLFGTFLGLIAAGVFAFDRFMLVTHQYTVWRMFEVELAIRTAQLERDFDRMCSVLDTSATTPLGFSLLRDLCHQAALDVLEEIKEETEAWRDRFTAEMARVQSKLRRGKKPAGGDTGEKTRS